MVLMTHGASLPKSEENHRQGKTLGLLTVGTSALGSTVGSVGAALGTAVGIISAVKPLVLLGLGKCKFLKYRKCKLQSELSPYSWCLKITKKSN